MRPLRLATIVMLLLCPACVLSQVFKGLESENLPKVEAEWGLKIVFFDVGQADAILLLTPNGEVAVIDTGHGSTAAGKIADFLANELRNGVGSLDTINLLYSTHYDRDHIGGVRSLVKRGIRIEKAFDQGPSGKCSLLTPKGKLSVYAKYLSAIGDPDGDNRQGADEPGFIRRKIRYGHVESIGHHGRIKLHCVAVRGDTKGRESDIDRDPRNATGSFDENPGSIALVIQLGDFEFYTAGDQTSGEWKSKPATEEAVLESDAIPGGNDIDVLKVSHHGSDTSTSKRLAEELLPEVAIISTEHGGHELPKRVVLKQLQNNRSYVLITGNGQDAQGRYADSCATHEDDAFTPSPNAVFNQQGDVTVLVSPKGDRYTVTGKTFTETFSAVDTDNLRQ